MWSPDNLRTKGALAVFHQALEAGPSVWPLHAMTINSTTNAETLVFPGFVPRPRQFLGDRQFQGARDFTYTVTNNEYELSMIVDRKHWEDDQTGLINARFQEMGETWREYKDALFATLLTNGNVSGNNGWDGVVFHGGSRTIGGSGTIDNDITENIVDTAAATTAEAQASAGLAWRTFSLFNDDQGRPFNAQAVTNMRVICPPGHTGGFYGAMNATLTGGGDSNVFTPTILKGVDSLAHLTTTTEVYFSALGSVRKPFIYQERSALEVVVLGDAENVALHNGVMALTRQRFILTYGEPRRSIYDI